MPTVIGSDLKTSESIIHSLPPVVPTHPGPYAPYAPHPGPYAPTPYPHYPAPHPHAALPDSKVYRNPYEEPGHRELVDAIRTKDADLPVNIPIECFKREVQQRVQNHEIETY